MAVEETTGKVLIVVPTVNLRDIRWKEEFTKWKLAHLYHSKRVETICYTSLVKKADQHYELVILDEIHRLTERNFEFFQYNKVDKVMGLTATFPIEWEKKALVKQIAPQVFNYPLHQAQKDGVVASFSTFLFLCNLLPAEKKAYNKADRMVTYFRARNENMHKKYLGERARVIYNSEAKQAVAKKIIDKTKNKRMLIFSGSILQSEALCDDFYHSKSNRNGYNAFVNGDINHLSCVKALDEGEDIPNVTAALVTQLSSKERSIVQRIGRAVRWEEGKKAKIYIIAARDTRDMSWVETALENINYTVYNGETFFD
jgi:superfamily II DNA or RNA helicase